MAVGTLDRSECWEIFKNAKLASIGFIHDGHPVVLPAPFVVIDQAFYLRTQLGTLEAQKGMSVCITALDLVENPPRLESASAWGITRAVRDGTLGASVASALRDKYRSEADSPLRPMLGGRTGLAGPAIISIIPDRIEGFEATSHVGDFPPS